MKFSDIIPYYRIRAMTTSFKSGDWIFGKTGTLLSVVDVEAAFDLKMITENTATS
jgi:hydrogenase maturation factor